MSYGIESPSDEFSGECGIEIAETVNRYERGKATALEVWMFDKNDTRTVNAMLVSEHALNDYRVRKKLEAKGDLILVKPDAVVELETETLRLRVRILDMQYGFSDTLPALSFFNYVVVELAAWRK